MLRARLRVASAWSQKARAGGISSANPLASSSSRKPRQILAPGHVLGDGVEAIPGRRLHQLEILLVLRGGSRRDLVEKLAGVARIGAAELGEGSEEMIVPGLALRGNEAAHGEGIDQLVVEALVLRHVGGGNVARFAHRLRLRAGLDRLRLGEALGDRIDAETVLAADADEGLGVDRAVEMIVQVGALRHALEKVAERKRIAANGVERLRRAKLGIGLLRREVALLLADGRQGQRAREKHGDG